jgi:Protein of unknown function with HXXEE motif
MNEFSIIVYLLPLVFMLHDFEEIIFFKPWICRNKVYLKQRFPKIADKLLPHFENLSVSAFSFAVAEEFLIISAVTIYAIHSDNYYAWIGLFLAFSIHLVAHIIQWIIIRRYIPCIVTSLLFLPYCIYGTITILNSDLFQPDLILWWFLACFILVVLNLIFAHKLGEKLDKRLAKWAAG